MSAGRLLILALLLLACLLSAALLFGSRVSGWIEAEQARWGAQNG